MYYYIDGYNLLYFFSSVTRDDLISYLNEKLKKAKFKSILVFDNKKSIGSHGYLENLQVVFTQNQSADDYIIECCSYKKQKTVVTSDNHLASVCKDLGADIISLEDFIKYLKKSSLKKEKKDICDSEYDIERLEEIFENRLKGEASSKNAEQKSLEKF